MITRYSVDSDVTLTIPYVADADVGATPAAGRYRLLNGNTAVVLLDWQSLSVTPSAASDNVTLLAIYNGLALAGTTETRELQYELTLTSGAVVQKSIIYALGETLQLQVMVNSFQTYPNALLVAESMAQLNDGWTLATDAQRRAALAEVYQYLLQPKYKNIDPAGSQSKVLWGDIDYYQGADQVLGLRHVDLKFVSATDFAGYDSKFQNALYRAQILAADDFLGGDPVEERRRQGILSETVGESSNMYRAGTPLLWKLSRRVLETLAGYIDYSTRAGR